MVAFTHRLRGGYEAAGREPPFTPMVGVPVAWADCDDGNECTADVCVGGVCDHTPVEDDAECGGGRGACEASSCVGSFGCDEQGVRDAITLGGGPHTFFDCDNSVPVVTETEIVIDNDVILDGDGSLTVHGNEDHRVLSVAEGVSVSLKGLTVTGGFDGPGPKSLRNGAGIRDGRHDVRRWCARAADWGV